MKEKGVDIVLGAPLITEQMTKEEIYNQNFTNMNGKILLIIFSDSSAQFYRVVNFVGTNYVIAGLTEPKILGGKILQLRDIERELNQNEYIESWSVVEATIQVSIAPTEKEIDDRIFKSGDQQS